MVEMVQCDPPDSWLITLENVALSGSKCSSLLLEEGALLSGCIQIAMVNGSWHR